MTLPRGVSRRVTRQDIPVYRIHYSADPDRGAEWATAERKKYSSQGAWDREQEIIHEAGGGERLFADILNRYADKIIITSPSFQVSPYWRKIGGFDHGKANPTAALVAYVDFDGTIYIVREYYQPGLSPAQHKPQLEKLEGFLQAEVMADPSIFYKTQAQKDGTFKAIAQLYDEEGISNLGSAPENNELLGMERILAHWQNLDTEEPSLKIVCPEGYTDISRPVYGLHNEGCPNLLWELRRARREELTATQLVTKNPTEKIVDKDNHLRDCLKYIALSLPEPARKTPRMKAQEAAAGLDPTSAIIRYNQVLERERAAERPVGLGLRGQRNARRTFR